MWRLTLLALPVMVVLGSRDQHVDWQLGSVASEKFNESIGADRNDRREWKEWKEEYCPEQCLECCKYEKFGVGSMHYHSSSKFACILKEHLPLNPDRVTKFQPPDSYGCYDLKQRTSVGYQAKMTCPLRKTIKDLSNLPLCSTSSRCCCRRDTQGIEVGGNKCLEEGLTSAEYRKKKKEGIADNIFDPNFVEKLGTEDKVLKSGNTLWTKVEQQSTPNMYDWCSNPKYKKNGQNGLSYKNAEWATTTKGCCIKLSKKNQCAEWETIWSCGITEQTGIQYKRVMRGSCLSDQSSDAQMNRVYDYKGTAQRAKLFQGQCPIAHGWHDHVEEEGDCICEEACIGVSISDVEDTNKW